VERKVSIDVETGIRCMPSLKTTAEAPVRSQTSLFSGEVDTSLGGAGLEFFSVAVAPFKLIGACIVAPEIIVAIPDYVHVADGNSLATIVRDSAWVAATHSTSRALNTELRCCITG